ncbi:hypothetical protein [Nocardioides pantholopis]|uniref:hypothetical protein n=1 Tax=Nocardioides pantholopis TaxID=2483798 RepID=UPI000F09A0D1|nr:hypothetical protein [Nocardioides pantholopis]
MTYTLVAGTALGFDLARLPGGARAAAVLRTALACRPEDLDRIAAQHPGDCVRAGWAELLAQRPEDGRMAGTVGRAVEALLRGDRGDARVLGRLEAALLGDQRGLDRLVRHELLDWTWLGGASLAVQDPAASLAADVLVDAATAGYRETALDPAVRRAMAVPLLRSGVPLRDRTVPVGVEPLDRALATLASADATTRRRWRTATDERRAHTAAWAPAVHRATWALSVTERLRLALDAQLAAVAAFHDAGLTPRDAAYGVWNAASGAVVALTAIDLIDTADAETLLAGWTAVYGPPHLA